LIFSNDRSCDEREEVDCNEGDQLKYMIHDIEENFTDCPHLFKSLKNDSEKSSYNGYTTFTKLSAMLRLYNLKARNAWSDKSFTVLFKLLKNIPPEDNELPDCTYDAKKIMCSMSMNYEMIHVFSNDCICTENIMKV